MTLWHRFTGIPKRNKINIVPRKVKNSKAEHPVEDISSAEDLFDKIQAMESVLCKLRAEAEELDKQITCATALALGVTNKQNPPHWLKEKLDSDWPTNNLYTFSCDDRLDSYSEQKRSNGKDLFSAIGIFIK